MAGRGDAGSLSRLEVGERVLLSPPRERGEMSVEEAVARRRSVREFSPDALGIGDVSQLLWCAQGLTSRDGGRAAPSAGACYPLELYLACEHGLFRYQAEAHALVKVSGADVRHSLARAALGQSFIAQAPVSLVFAAVYRRTTGRYGERGIRYVHIDVGHAAENVQLQAVALGLASVAVGAFDDGAVAKVLGLPADQAPVYIIPVGQAARG